MDRLIAVGDIHGHYNKLCDLMDNIALGKGDQIVFLGDFVDYGPQTPDVIEYMIDMHKFRNATYIMGNHDSWFLEFMEHAFPDPAWLACGGLDTLETYGWTATKAGEVPEKHVEWLRHLHKPFKVVHGDYEYVFSHGMLCPTKPIESRFDRHDALWGRPSSFGLRRGQFPEQCAWSDEQFNVFGHTPHSHPTFYGNEVLGQRGLGIDTGAKMQDRPLTAAILPRRRGERVEFISDR